jgi:molybdenum cofactor cytidylyltransferase
MTASPHAALILAAGRSERMEQFKPLLAVGGQTLIQRAVAVFRQNRIVDIIVVTGYRAADLEAALTGQAVRIARNASYSQGMFSSVLAGIRQLPPHCEAFFVLPVDTAFVRPPTIARLMEAFRQQPGRICYPCTDNRRGHPPLIPARLATAIAGQDGKGGLRRVLKQWAHLALDVPVADPHILLDIDTPADLLKLERMSQTRSF